MVDLEAYDEQPLPGRNWEAIDFPVASQYFLPVKKLKRADLQTLKIMVPCQGRQVASVGGMLLFGRDRFRDFPDSYVQAGAFAGKDKARMVDAREFREPLPGLIEQTLDFVGRQLRQGFEIKGARSTLRHELPPLALREAVINALVHADYSQQGSPTRVAVFDDRLEIENPGLLPFGLTPEDAFKGVSKVRNRVLARVFKELGYIEQWGSGLQRIQDACRAMGLKPAVLEELGNRVRLTLFRTPQAVPAVRDAGDQRVLDALRAKGSLAPAQIAKLLRLTTRAARNRMNKLAQLGLVRTMGTSSQDPKRTYMLVESATPQGKVKKRIKVKKIKP